MSDKVYPIEFEWDGNVMKPRPRFHALANKQYVVGECYVLGINEARSSASHRHYFAELNKAWDNLPEDKVKRYPSPEHLRKWALIRAGYYNERSIVATDSKQASAIAALAEALDEFAVTVVRGNVVKVYTAKSQADDAMSNEEFQKSKSDVLAILSEAIGVTKKELEKESLGKSR